MADLLLVDNDRRIVDLAAWFLERRGHAVRAALSYREARGLLGERLPDLMLADLELGEENGREELPRLEREGLLPRTLVVSGYLDAALEAELRRLPPVVGAFAKPYEMRALEARIDECLAEPAPVAARVLEAGGGAGATASVPPSADVRRVEPPPPAGTDAAAEDDDLDEDDDGWVEIVPFRRDPEDAE